MVLRNHVSYPVKYSDFIEDKTRLVLFQILQIISYAKYMCILAMRGRFDSVIVILSPFIASYELPHVLESNFECGLKATLPPFIVSSVLITRS